MTDEAVNQEPQDQAGPEETQPEKLQFEVTIEDSGAWKKKISLRIPRTEIDKEFENQFKEMRQVAEVPGFRKGRAPKRLIEKRFRDEVADQVKYKLLAQALEQVEEEHKLEVLTEPDIKPGDIILPDEGDFQFSYEIEVQPEFSLPALENIRVEKQLIEVTDAKIDSVINNIRQRFGKLEPVAIAAKDDSLTARIEMRIEGVEEPEILDDYSLWVSPCGIRAITIEGIETLLEGVAVGDKRSCEAVVPENHPKKEWVGKKARFEIEIKTVMRMVLPEMNAEFLADMGVESEKELRDRISEDMESRIEQEVRQAMMAQITKYLDINIQFDLPAGVTERHANRILVRRLQELLNQGVPRDSVEKNLEQLRARFTSEAQAELKMSFILQKVIEAQGIHVGEGELNTSISQMAHGSGQRPEKVRDQLIKDGLIESLRIQLGEQKALERLLEMAEVVDLETKDGDNAAMPTETN